MEDGMDLAYIMECLHNAAAPMDPSAAEMVRQYADRRSELLGNRVLKWINTIY